MGLGNFFRELVDGISSFLNEEMEPIKVPATNSNSQTRLAPGSYDREMLLKQLRGMRGMDAFEAVRGLLGTYITSRPGHDYPEDLAGEIVGTFLSCRFHGDNDFLLRSHFIRNILPIHKDKFGYVLAEKFFREYPDAGADDLYEILGHVPSYFGKIQQACIRGGVKDGWLIIISQMIIDRWDDYSVPGREYLLTVDDIATLSAFLDRHSTDYPGTAMRAKEILARAEGDR